MMMIIPNLSERKRVLRDDDVVHHVDHPVGGHLVMLIIVIIMTMMLMVDHSVGQHGRHDGHHGEHEDDQHPLKRPNLIFVISFT